MPPTISEIARHWGVSQPRVSQLVKEGCPTNSLKAADRWREARGQKREGKHCNVAASDKKKRGRPQLPNKPSRTGDSLQDALNNAIAVADVAFEEYEHARVNQMITLSLRLSEHSKALETRLKAESAYREELERRKILVPKAEITEACRRAIESMTRRLKKIPQESGPQCNPQEPLQAVTILERAVREVMDAGQKALRALP